MASDALIVSVSEYPFGNQQLRPLPGTARDHLRMLNWLKKQEKDITIDDFTWPLPSPASSDKSLWNVRNLEARLHNLIRERTQQSRRRLFVYASTHGMAAPPISALPAVYCASHSFDMPDLFVTSGWVPQFTEAPFYQEYLCFFDCCNDAQLDTLPVIQYPQTGYREPGDKPGVLAVAACGRGQKALDTPTGGIFTDVLLEALSGSAGRPGMASVTAADVVAYLKENVPIRAAQYEVGHVQTPVAWLDAGLHIDLDEFVLFEREPVSGVAVSALLNGLDSVGAQVLDARLQHIGPVTVAPNSVVLLPDLFPGTYLLRGAGESWQLFIRVKTTVNDDGSVQAAAQTLAQ